METIIRTSGGECPSSKIRVVESSLSGWHVTAAVSGMEMNSTDWSLFSCAPTEVLASI